MAKIDLKGNSIWLFGVLAISLIYLIKVTYFPNQLDQAKRRIGRIAAIATYQAQPNVMGIGSRINSLKNECASSLIIDVSDYTKGNDQRNYKLSDIESHAPQYFRYFTHVTILLKDITVLPDNNFQLTVILRGRTSEGAIDDAYNIIAGYNNKWKLIKIRVMSPPKTKSSPVVNTD